MLPACMRYFTWLWSNVLRDEVPPAATLADEAHAHRLPLPSHGESGLGGEIAHLRLGEASKGEQNLREDRCCPSGYSAVARSWWHDAGATERLTIGRYLFAPARIDVPVGNEPCEGSVRNRRVRTFLRQDLLYVCCAC